MEAGCLLPLAVHFQFPYNFYFLGSSVDNIWVPSSFNSTCNDGAVSLGRLQAQSFVFISPLCLHLLQKAITHSGLLHLWKVFRDCTYLCILHHVQESGAVCLRAAPYYLQSSGCHLFIALTLGVCMIQSPH